METERLLDVDMKFLWHPYTQMKDYEDRDLLLVDHADGVYLFDAKGKRYYDTISSWWCILHGHNHPTIKSYVKGQLDRLEQIHFAGTTHEGAIRLAERLASITPEPLTRVFYSDDGSTACEVAIKMSVQYWKQTGHKSKDRFIALERGYHGDTIGTMSLGGVPAFKGPFDRLTFDSFTIPTPYCYHCPCGIETASPACDSCGTPRASGCAIECLEPLRRLLEGRAEDIAALILEPLLMGAGGMIVYPVEYLQEVARLCRRYGVHLILDEVATGFGRTGRMFALEHAGICPDFLCISKGLTGGYLPMSATMTTEDVFSAFYGDYNEGKTFFHGHTFTANPLAVAAALGSLRVFEEEKTLEELSQKVDVLQSGIRGLARFDTVGDIRGVGMVASLELVADKDSKKPFPPRERRGFQVYLEGLKHGLILRPLGDVIYLFLPLCVTVDQINDILSRCNATFEGLGL